MRRTKQMGWSSWILAVIAAIAIWSSAQLPCAAQDAAPQAQQQQTRKATVSLAAVPVTVLTEAFSLTNEQTTRITTIHDWFIADRKTALAALPAATSPSFHQKLQSFLHKQQDLAEQASRDMEARLTDPQKEQMPDVLSTMTDIAQVGIPLNSLVRLNLTDDQIGKMVAIAAEMNNKIDALAPEEGAAQVRTLRQQANTRAQAALSVQQKKILSDEQQRLLADPREQAVAAAVLDQLSQRSVSRTGSGEAPEAAPAAPGDTPSSPGHSDVGNGNVSAPSVALGASKTSITAGETVMLTWSSSGATQIVSSSFGAATLQGALNVTPTATTTYTLTVGGGTGPDASSSVTVVVGAGAPRYLLVGNSENADVKKMQAQLQKIGPVTVQSTMPNDGAAFDAVVIHESGNITPDDARKVQTLLGQGKGVVLMQRAPRLLATGDMKKRDVSAIAAWFGGVTSLDGPGAKAAWKVRSGSGVVSLPDGLAGQEISAGGATFAHSVGEKVDIVAGFAIKVLGTTSWNDIGAFAFAPPSGGRVYFQGNPNASNLSGGSMISNLFHTLIKRDNSDDPTKAGSDQGATAALFQSGAYWAATGQ